MHDHEHQPGAHAHHHEEEGTLKEYLKFALVLLVIVLLAYGYNSVTGVGLMQAFMGIFFVVFAVFKIVDLHGFVMSFSGYDVIARRSKFYAYVYPFIELSLGVAYLGHPSPVVHWVTLGIMTVGAIGVTQQLLRKSNIKCACLGTYIKLPLTTVSLTEDLLMAAMALYMIIN